VLHEIESATSMKDKLLRELGEATARVSKSETDWKALAKSVAALEHELDIERKKQLRAPCALPFRVG
jgi:hypothetical protein